MILTAVAIAAQLDVKLDQQIAKRDPDVSLTAGLERSHAVSSRLADLRGRAVALRPGGRRRGRPRRPPQLPALGAGAGLHRHPAVVQHAGRPAADAGRPARPGRARRLLDLHVHQLPAHAPLPRGLGRALPRGRADHRRRAHAGVLLRARRRQRRRGDRALGIRYPVAQDNDMATWNAWGNQYWPAEFLIDATGQVRDAHFGEGDYAKTEAAIRALLAAAGRPPARPTPQPAGAITPVGAGHARDLPRRRPGPGLARRRSRRPGTHDYRRRAGLAPAQRLRLRRALDDRPRGRPSPGRARGSTPRSRPRTSTSCSARRPAARTGRVAS